MNWDSDSDNDNDGPGYPGDGGTGGRMIFHADGVHSAVYRQKDPSSRWIATKIVSFHANERIKPHDIVKEAEVLARAVHPNIIPLLEFVVNKRNRQYELTMPLVPISLQTHLLDSPYFSPHPIPLLPNLASPPNPITHFDILAKSVIYQAVLALAHLHTLDLPIGYRDIKPGNILMQPSGRVVLVDFGISFVVGDVNQEVEQDGAMCCQVASGVYRAPELMFSPLMYDACATDLWSLGVLLSSFFTPIRLVRRTSWDDDFDDDDNEGSGRKEEDGDIPPFIISPAALKSRSTTWARETLFDSSRGELGLLWSIFKVKGTPDAKTWPSFTDLPGAKGVTFKSTPRTDISRLLPNLPSPRAAPLDLIERLTTYDPSVRLTATDALSHAWFASNDPPVILPRDYPELVDVPREWEGASLEDILKPVVDRVMAQIEGP